MPKVSTDGVPKLSRNQIDIHAEDQMCIVQYVIRICMHTFTHTHIQYLYTYMHSCMPTNIHIHINRVLDRQDTHTRTHTQKGQLAVKRTMVKSAEMDIEKRHRHTY